MRTLLLGCALVAALASCKKESEDLQIDQIADYAPLQKGKYISYSCDSLVFTNFGTVETHRFYRVRYEVTDSFTDALGRKAWRITRSIAPQSGGNYVPDNTFQAVDTRNGFEFNENNLRFLKLILPIEEGRTWKGNSAIDVTSLGSEFQYLYDWDYTYTGVGAPLTIGAKSFDNTVTVLQRDDSFNLPVIPPPSASATNIAGRDYSVEVYAKGVGMVSKDFIHWEYQKAYNSGAGGYDGYGIKLRVIDFN